MGSDSRTVNHWFVLVVVATCLLVVVGYAGLAGVPLAGDASATIGGATQQGDDGLSGEIDLGTTATKFLGNATDDNAGYAVASAGDVDGDGANDVVVTAPFNDTNGPNSGAVYLFLGPVDTGDIDVSEADATLVGASGDRAGWSVAAGDVDGDGFSDVVVGAPQNDSAGTNSGAVHVVTGGESVPERVELGSDADATFHGDGAFDLAGYSVATVAVDGEEGEDDDALLVGAPKNNSTATDAGAAYLVEDLDAADTDDAADADGDLGDAADVRYVGAAEGDRAGWSVAAAGDVDDDGSDDVVVGAPRNDSGASSAGAAYVLATDGEGDVPVQSGLALEGVAASDQAGFAVAGAGDVNADGTDDVVVGAPFNDSAGDNAGEAYLVHGGGDLGGNQSLDDADVVLAGANASDRAGWSVAAAGDADEACDDGDEVLVGAPYNNSTADDAGAAYLVGGGEAGERSLDDAGATFQGEGEEDLAGWSVAGANDSTGDGTHDLLIGAIQNETDGNETGAAYLVAGHCPVVEETPTPTDSPTPTDTPTSPAGNAGNTEDTDAGVPVLRLTWAFGAMAIMAGLVIRRD